MFAMYMCVRTSVCKFLATCWQTFLSVLHADHFYICFQVFVVIYVDQFEL